MQQTLTLDRLRFGRFPLRALALALLVGLVFGVGQVGEPLENAMQVARNKLRLHSASQSIAVVAIDDQSVAEIGPAPWGNGRLADLVVRLRGAGARRIHFDVELTADGLREEANRLEEALREAKGTVLLATRFADDPVTGTRTVYQPAERFARHAQLVNTNLPVWWDNAVWRLPYAVDVGGRLLPSLSSVLGGEPLRSTRLFPIDFSIDVRSIPLLSASDVLGNRISPRQIAGRDIVVARTDFSTDHFRAPGFRLVPGALFHVIAAETLRAGPPVDVEWPAPLGVALLLASAILYLRRRPVVVFALSLGFTGLFAGPLILDEFQVHTEVVPAIAALLAAAFTRLSASLRRSYAARGTTNPVTGMPNLQSLRHASEPLSGIVVAARVKNYAQITTTLFSHHEKELVGQVVARLKFGTGSSTIYQADEGVFVWIAQPGSTDAVIQQLEALHALFRSPIVIATRIIDLSVTFGLDPDGSRALIQRASSSLVAADEAARDGKRWASFHPASLEDAEWTMSLLARLDLAIDNGELWVAYQPKLDCDTMRIVGAEALVRWTHPEKGQVYPDQFIGAAEQGGRIERLTFFVLDAALAAAARINTDGRIFGIAVNLSALLLSSPRLVADVEALLRKHRLEPGLLTLEVTETSTIGSEAEAFTNLERLSALGVRLSIDDYGTGFSTLEYLRRIPAAEIKIDRSFVTMLHKSQSDRIMVNSTIQLAHSLGRTVVAEGVETEDILQELVRMGCDIVQGYHVGRPLPLASLLDQLGTSMGRKAA